jgi:hypothetical protein
MHRGFTATGKRQANGANDNTHGQQFRLGYQDHGTYFARWHRTVSRIWDDPRHRSGLRQEASAPFGEKVFDTIEAKPERLREVTGIGPVRASRITAAWAEQKIAREIMVFLKTAEIASPR